MIRPFISVDSSTLLGTFEPEIEHVKIRVFFSEIKYILHVRNNLGCHNCSKTHRLCEPWACDRQTDGQHFRCLNLVCKTLKMSRVSRLTEESPFHFLLSVCLKARTHVQQHVKAISRTHDSKFRLLRLLGGSVAFNLLLRLVAGVNGHLDSLSDS